MTRKDIETQVQAMADGDLDEEGLAALQDALRHDPEARRFFRESMEIEQLLADATRRPSYAPSSNRGMPGILRRRSKTALAWAGLAAAAALAVGALMLHRMWLDVPDGGVPVAFTPGTSWSGDVEGGRLEPGGRVEVDYGALELSLPNEVSAVIEGPASVRLIADDLIGMETGRGWFRVGKPGRGFRVRTPQSEVTDLGTEFGLITLADRLDEVHVFEGSVELEARFALKQTMTLSAGSGAGVSPIGRWFAKPLEHDRFFKRLPPALPGVLFLFDGKDPLRPQGEHPAVPGMKTNTAGGRPHWVEGVRGRALAIRGPDDWMETDWPGIDGDAPRTIACWIRMKERPRTFPGIVAWGSSGRAGRCKLLVAPSPGKGAPVLRLSLGHDVNFSGTTPLEIGKWHHIAAVFRGTRSEQGDMVELFLDGERETVDSSFSRPPDEDRDVSTQTTGPDAWPLRIGSSLMPNPSEVFLGDIDEVRILPGALSPQQIRGLMRE